MSNWSSQISLHSTLKKSGALPSRNCSLFQRSSGGTWNSFGAETEVECQDKDGKTIMKVHNVDRTYKSILLDDEMRVGQVCAIMLDKNHSQDSIVHWQIFEEPGDFPGFERQVEDDEFAMDLQRRWPAAVAPSRIWFRHNQKKYNFSSDLDRLLLRKDAYPNGNMLYKNLSFPGISEGVVMLKRPRGKWSQVLCFLVMSAIFFSKKHFGYSKRRAKYLLDLTSMDVYVPQEQTDVTKILHTPTLHTLLLVPSSIGLLDPEAIFAIGLKTRECMLAWAEGLRFHKHGQQKLARNLEDALNNRFCSPVEEKQSSLTSLRSFDLIMETPESCRQNRSSHQFFFGNDYQVPNKQHYLHRELGSRLNVHESVERFEGIIFRSGVPHLLLEFPDGPHKYSIVNSHDRGFDEKHYKLSCRPERFETLSDLYTFYEERRHLLIGEREIDERSALTLRPVSFQVDAATAF